MVVAVLQAVLTNFKAAHGEVSSVYIKSDNASNLKNKVVLRFLKGLKIMGHDSSEPPMTIAGCVPSQPGAGKGRVIYVYKGKIIDL